MHLELTICLELCTSDCVLRLTTDGQNELHHCSQRQGQLNELSDVSDSWLA